MTVTIEIPRYLSFLFPKQKEKTFTTTQIANELGMSAKEFNRKLYQKGIQYYNSGMWMLYSGLRDKGYTKVESFVYKVKGDITRNRYQMVWTEKGRSFIINKLTQ